MDHVGWQCKMEVDNVWGCCRNWFSKNCLIQIAREIYRKIAFQSFVLCDLSSLPAKMLSVSGDGRECFLKYPRIRGTPLSALLCVPALENCSRWKRSMFALTGWLSARNSMILHVNLGMYRTSFDSHSLSLSHSSTISTDTKHVGAYPTVVQPLTQNITTT